jgi:hypothetical protein
MAKRKNIQQIAAEEIGRIVGVNPKHLLEWSTKFDVNLAEKGYILTNKSHFDAVFEDLIYNKLDKLKDLVK